MQIPLLGLRKQYANIKQEIDNAIADVLNSGLFILGGNVKALEEEIAKFCGCGFGIGVANGTDALELSLRALGIGSADEVITTPFTFIATAEAISIVGARPVFCDINLDDYAIDVRQIKRKVTAKTKAIIPVHLYGQPCDIISLRGVAEEFGLKIVEDCAQAIGAEYAGKPVGSFGDCGCFSFFPSKNLGAYGDGGMVITSNADIAQKLRLLRAHGSNKKYMHNILGRNSRLDELQAAILRVKLKYLPDWNKSRIRYASIYSAGFKKFGLDRDIVLPIQIRDRLHIYHLYCVRVKDRNALVKHLEAKGVHTAVHYPLGLHLQEVYAHLGYKRGDFPNTELAAEEVLALPLYPEMSEEQIEYVIESIQCFYK